MEIKEWYGVKVFFKYYMFDSVKGLDIVNKNYKHSYEEIVYLVKAVSFDESIAKAEKLAHKYEREYINVDLENVKVKFLEIVESFQLFAKRLNDGVELFSQIFYLEEDVFDEYINAVYPEE